MPILRPNAARFHERRISSVMFTSARFDGKVYMRVGVARAHADLSYFGHLGFTKMGDSVLWTPMPVD